jgi:hypothetical protein
MIPTSDKHEVLSWISNLRQNKCQRESFLKLRDYLLSSDIHSDSDWLKRLRREISKGESSYLSMLGGLFDKEGKLDNFLAYASSQGIEKKELFEAYFFNYHVKNFFKKSFGTVHDMCSGSGINGFYLLSEKSCSRVEFYDIKQPRIFDSLKGYFTINNPAPNFNANLEDITKIKEIVPSKDSIITAVHACGSLTDKVISIAINSRMPFAVVPCCHPSDDSTYLSSEIIASFPDPSQAIDAIRLYNAKSQGYEVALRTIPKEVTEKNRIIIGNPL